LSGSIALNLIKLRMRHNNPGHSSRAMIGKPRGKPPGAAPRPHYGITRVDNERHRTFAWIVTIQRRNRIWRRSFSDRSHGGKGKALRAAKAFRDQILRQHPPMTRAEYCRIKRRNNKSGLAGVCRYVYLEGQDSQTVERGYWLAFWTHAPGVGKRIKFSISRFGERGALRRARHARKEALAALDGEWINSTGLRQWLRGHHKANGSRRRSGREIGAKR